MHYQSHYCHFPLPHYITTTHHMSTSLGCHPISLHPSPSISNPHHISPPPHVSSKLVQTRPNSSKLIQTRPNLSKLVQTRPNLSKLVQTCSNLFKLVQICPKLQHDKILLNLSKHLQYNLTQSYHFLSILKLTCKHV